LQEAKWKGQKVSSRKVYNPCFALRRVGNSWGSSQLHRKESETNIFILDNLVAFAGGILEADIVYR
jgi:hypothetical protein